MPDLLRQTSIEQAPDASVRRCGTILREFSHLTQDSGNVSWLVDQPGRPLFVKTAGLDHPHPPGAAIPYFDHAGRIALLRNAVELAASCAHPALPELLNVIESPAGPMLVYAAAPGELVGVPAGRRSDPTSPYLRLARLAAPDRLSIFDTLIDLHDALARLDWVAGDLYDGCLIVDFASLRLSVIDLDSYRRGPSVNDMGRMFGSTRFMAPEEFRLGAALDHRTTVFTLGRLAWHFGTGLTENAADFCGDDPLAAVVQRATEPEPDARFPTVADFTAAWRDAHVGPDPAG